MRPVHSMRRASTHIDNCLRRLRAAMEKCDTMHINRLTKRKSGFTLIEIMVVVLVIVVLISIAMPNWMHARASSRSKACCENLRQIDSAKEQWGMTTRASAMAEPTTENLVPDFLKGADGSLPPCPSGGGYAINNMQTAPTCDIGDNGTPHDYDDHIVP